jgi:hypothetical protein
MRNIKHGKLLEVAEAVSECDKAEACKCSQNPVTF